MVDILTFRVSDFKFISQVRVCMYRSNKTIKAIDSNKVALLTSDPMIDEETRNTNKIRKKVMQIKR